MPRKKSKLSKPTIDISAIKPGMLWADAAAMFGMSLHDMEDSAYCDEELRDALDRSATYVLAKYNSALRAQLGGGDPVPQPLIELKNIANAQLARSKEWRN